MNSRSVLVGSNGQLSDFLALPSDLRREIYQAAGVVAGRTLVVGRNSTDCVKPNFKVSNQLLRTCRSIYLDVSSILYSENLFELHFTTPSVYNFLLNLRPATIQKLRRLAISFNSVLCYDYHKWHQCGHPGYRLYAADHTVPGLESLPPKVTEVLSQWPDTAKNYFAQVRPNDLKLWLTCDVRSSNDALLVLSPLLISHSPLAECSIRLAETRRPELAILAKNTVNRLITPNTRAAMPFRYLELPPEVRYMVLECTDLVTPLKEVEWNESEGFFLRYATSCASFNGLAQGSDWHHACQFRNCSTFDCPYNVEQDRSLRPSTLVDCFCRRYHSAYSSNSSSCRCWESPLPLFLVCRQLRAEAEKVFFQENRIIVTPVDGVCYAPVMNPMRFGASAFLHRTRLSALRCLRSLEIVFPPFQHDYCTSSSTVLEDWISTLARAKSLLQLNRLKLCIYMADHLFIDQARDNLPEFRSNMNQQDGKEIIETYKRILGPFSEFRELEQFHLHLTWPWSWNRDMEDMLQEERDCYLSEFTRPLEVEIGTSIMGEETYACQNIERGTYQDSQWLVWTRMDRYSG